MPSSDDRNAERARPPSVERVPTLTEVVELAPWSAPPLPMALHHDADETLPYEATVLLPPGGTLREVLGETLPDLPLDLSTDAPSAAPSDAQSSLPADLPSLAGLSLDSGPAWPAADNAAMPAWQDAGPPPQLDPAALVTRVLEDLAPRIDMLFETQLRDALAPALQRAVDSLALDVRAQLSAALRGVVEQAVERTLQQHGER